ncbi:MAG: Crp/Fnr family transcriptional regulator [Desulfopila sp.]
MVKISVRERLPKGALLDPDCIYYLQQGLCVLNHIGDDGGEKTILYIQEMSLMGFMPFLVKSLVDERQQAERKTLSNEYFIKTRCECDVLKVDGDRFFAMLEKSPRLFKTVLGTLCQNYSNTMELLSKIINKSAPVRVCRMILEFRQWQKDRLVLLPHLTYYDIGIFTALHVITVTKIFKALFAERILSKSGRLVVIERQEVLLDIVDGTYQLNYQ